MKSRRPKSNPPPRTLSPRRMWIFRLMALLLPVGLLAALEIGLRLAGYGYDTHFFRPLRIGSEDYLVQNDAFSYRFFPPETARNPGPVRMPARKAPGTFRIFILGESAAMGDPEPAYGAYRYLEMLLREKYPDQKFELINVAFTAINSHVIVPIARECAEHDGDLWIVYMGNNEMVGPFGAATVFGRQAPPLPYVRLVTAVQRTRTGQWLTELSRKFKGGGTKAASWGGMQMFLQNEIAPTSPLKETVYRNFEKNLDDIVRAGIGSGAKVLLNTVAVNLRDCPPFASLSNSNLPPADRAQFQALKADGLQAEAQSNFAVAGQKFEQAAKLDSQSAEVQYRLGQCLQAQNDLTHAREHFQAASDNDALPFRADSRINAALRNERKKIKDDHLILCDAAAALAGAQSDGLCGQETFYEHVHFDFAGSYQLARVWADQIEPLLPHNASAWASQAACEARLGLSDWNRALVIEHMIGRMQQPPFSSQAINNQRLAALQARADQLRQGLNPDKTTRTREMFGQSLALAPEDYVLRENYALFLQSIGSLADATTEWRRIREEMPHDYLTHFQLGRLLAEQGQAVEAEAALHTALAIRPSLTEGWLELGKVQAAQQNHAGALASFATALKQRPQDWQPVFRTGTVLAKMNDHTGAVEKYRAAIELSPANWEPHFELGGELDAAGQLDAARREFGEAAKLNPNNARTHFNYGVMLAKQNRLDAAQHEFEETSRLDPTYTKAQEYLAQLQRMRKPAP